MAFVGHTLDVTVASNPISDESLIAAQTPLVGIVQEPLNDTSTFPGLYPSFILSSSPTGRTKIVKTGFSYPLNGVLELRFYEYL